MKFYNLTQFVNSKAIYFSVHRTHYGLPQAGALSQQRLFKHLEKNGYIQCPNTPSFFRNHDGSIRFSLVVDDFAILWTKRQSIDHFIATLRQLYSVKINWEGTKYIGINIDINRKERYATLSMAGYIDKHYKRFDLRESRAPKHRQYIFHLTIKGLGLKPQQQKTHQLQLINRRKNFNQ